MSFLNKSLICLSVFLCSLNTLAQNNITLSINKDQTYAQKKIISNLLKIHNNNNEDFEGYVNLTLPNGLRSISSDLIETSVKANDSTFVPIKLIETGFIPAGRLQYTIKLLDKNKRLVKQMNSSVYIEENHNLRLLLENTSLYISNTSDSVRVKSTVHNYGNKNEFITLVYRLTDRDGGRYFVEQKKLVPMRSEVDFEYSFLPNRYHIDQQSTLIQLTALFGNPQTVFDNATLTLMSVVSNRKFIIPQTFDHSGYSSQSATLVYRQIGQLTHAFQFLGQGDLNLHLGNLNARANILQSNTQNEIMATNTGLTYQINNNEYSVGNINEMLEHSIFGRGAYALIQNRDKSLGTKVGFADNNFNLFSSTPFLKNGYSVYGIQNWGKPGDPTNIKADIIYRDAPNEFAKHTIAGINRSKYFNKDWQVKYQVHGGYSFFDANMGSKPSFSTSLNYSGKINQTRLTGNFYASSDYFPGNRRGNRQFQQSINRSFENGVNIWLNTFLMDISPRYINQAAVFKTQNNVITTGFSFPKFNNTSISLGYHHQNENSNSYGLFLNPEIESERIKSKANRASLMYNWHSSNLKNLVSIITDYGQINYSGFNDHQNQIKTNISYSYKTLNLNVSYQKGAYYLSEYISSLNFNKEFSRLQTSLFYTKNLFQNKLNTNFGFSYIKDQMIGNTPSGNFSLKYIPNKDYVFFGNSNWYQYKFNDFPQQSLLNVELGLTRNFTDKAIITKRKGILEAFVYLDKNVNNIFDGDDEPAKEFLIDFDQTTFITDKNGRFIYYLLPYQNYQLRPIKENGWFNEGKSIAVSKLHQKIEIPLKQMGSISGLIRYNYDPQLSLEFEPKASNINFVITKDDKLFQRVSSDAQGRFLEFLPTGEYQIELEVASLPENTYTSNAIKTFSITSGEMTHLPAFEIQVKSKKINIKKFGE